MRSISSSRCAAVGTAPSGVVSAGAFTQIKRALQNAVRECTEIMDRDRAVPLDERAGAAFLVALRPWQFSGFSQFLRQAG